MGVRAAGAAAPSRAPPRIAAVTAAATAAQRRGFGANSKESIADFQGHKSNAIWHKYNPGSMKTNISVLGPCHDKNDHGLPVMAGLKYPAMKSWQDAPALQDQTLARLKSMGEGGTVYTLPKAFLEEETAHQPLTFDYSKPPMAFPEHAGGNEGVPENMIEVFRTQNTLKEPKFFGIATYQGAAIGLTFLIVHHYFWEMNMMYKDLKWTYAFRWNLFWFQGWYQAG